jgi:hypothetical protein
MSPGGFSGELAFVIALSDGTKHEGAASRRYFWTQDGHPVEKNDMKDATPGYIAVRILEENGKHVLLSIPDGEVVKVNKEQIVSSEPTRDVPIRS